MTYIMVDIEADGPIPSDYSMVCFGAIVVEPSLDRTFYKGVVKDMFVNFKHLRKTKHTHNPVDDARGNAEALLQIKEQYGLKISLG
jgi:hypothetical protein